MLRRRILSDLENLESLHVSHAWVPGAENIRPSPETLSSKHQTLEGIGTQYAAESDFILEHIFSVSLDVGADGKLFADAGSVALINDTGRVFMPNQFPYVVPAGTHHWVMWYPIGLRFESLGPARLLQPADVAITANIEQDLLQQLQHERFDFVYYVNPKMTVPDIFHVQVFWTSWDVRPKCAFAC
jgi:hypothetical protein